MESRFWRRIKTNICCLQIITFCIPLSLCKSNKHWFGTFGLKDINERMTSYILLKNWRFLLHYFLYILHAFNTHWEYNWIAFGTTCNASCWSTQSTPFVCCLYTLTKPGFITGFSCLSFLQLLIIFGGRQIECIYTTFCWVGEGFIFRSPIYIYQHSSIGYRFKKRFLTFFPY